MTKTPEIMGNDILYYIKNTYAHYINNPKYVYTCCKNYIIILTKLQITTTNEEHKDVVDTTYACFRANKLMVSSIFHKFTPDICIDNIEDNTDGIISLNYFTYDIVKSVGGVPYYKSIDVAFYCGEPPNCYTGIWQSWYPNGAKNNIMTYTCGKLNGIMVTWYENKYKYNNESIKSEISYRNGKMHGECKYWYENGNIKRNINYYNGKLHGINTKWYDNEHKKYESEYRDGKCCGKHKTWNHDGHIISEENYYDGVCHGKCTYWYSNGVIHKEMTYRDGFPVNKIIVRNRCGMIISTQTIDQGCCIIL